MHQDVCEKSKSRNQQWTTSKDGMKLMKVEWQEKWKCAGGHPEAALADQDLLLLKLKGSKLSLKLLLLIRERSNLTQQLLYKAFKDWMIVYSWRLISIHLMLLKTRLYWRLCCCWRLRNLSSSANQVTDQLDICHSASYHPWGQQGYFGS